MCNMVLTLVFLHDGEASWLLLPSLVSLLSGDIIQPENTSSCILKVAVQFREHQKGQASAPITATTSVYLPKPASTDLPIRSDSVLTNAIGKDGVQARLI